MAIVPGNLGAQTASNGTPQVPALPTSIVAGDLLVLICLQSTLGSVTFTPPGGGGWTSRGRNANATQAMTLEVFTKTAVGGDSDPSVGGNNTASGWCTQTAAYRGVNTVTVLDQTTVLADAAAAQTWQPTGITTQTNGACVLSIVGSKDDNALTLSVANGYSIRMGGASYDATAGTGSDYSVGMAEQIFASAGAKTCPTWNQSANNNDAWVGITLALIPIVDSNCTPANATLTLTTFAPTVAVTNNVTVTPTTLALTLTTFAPTVTATNHQTVTPTTLSLTLTTFAPTVVASNHQAVTPTTLALSVSMFAPTVTASDHKTVTPSTLALSLTTFAPTVVVASGGVAVEVTPTTLTLTLTTFAPTVTINELPIDNYPPQVVRVNYTGPPAPISGVKAGLVDRMIRRKSS